MPYGKVEINTIQDMLYFIRYSCRDCQHSLTMFPCSGYQAELCNKKRQEAIKKLKEMVKNDFLPV